LRKEYSLEKPKGFSSFFLACERESAPDFGTTERERLKGEVSTDEPCSVVHDSEADTRITGRLEREAAPVFADRKFAFVSGALEGDPDFGGVAVEGGVPDGFLRDSEELIGDRGREFRSRIVAGECARYVAHGGGGFGEFPEGFGYGAIAANGRAGTMSDLPDSFGGVA
jgi:hypothetical protein